MYEAGKVSTTINNSCGVPQTLVLIPLLLYLHKSPAFMISKANIICMHTSFSNTFETKQNVLLYIHDLGVLPSINKAYCYYYYHYWPATHIVYLRTCRIYNTVYFVLYVINCGSAALFGLLCFWGANRFYWPMTNILFGLSKGCSFTYYVYGKIWKLCTLSICQLGSVFRR